MIKAKEYFNSTKLNWQRCWQQKKFRYTFFAGLFLISVILICFPFFFQYIEQRKGAILNDIILTKIPSADVSIIIFGLIWSSAFFMFITAVKNPDVFLLFLLSYVQLCVIRILTIFFFPLEAPQGIITLIDPLSNHFYGVPFITKDLFFSGHTSTLFLMFLCQKNIFVKYYTLVASLCVAALVLVQHIHYTIDVVFAFPFAYICYLSSKKLFLKK